MFRVIEKQARKRALEQEIVRLRRCIDSLDLRSNRYSWTRVGIFFGGIALSVIAFFVVGWWLCVLLALATILLFSIAAHFHGQIDRSMARHSLWLQIKRAHLARMTLDWENLPLPAQLSATPEHPFETDLDITGPHSIYHLLNVAVSREGRLRLRAWLLARVPASETIRGRQELVRELIPLSRFRDRLTLNSLISSRSFAEQLEGKRLLQWLTEGEASPLLLPLFWGSLALSLLTITLFVLPFFTPIPQLWLFSLFASFLLLFTTGKIRGELFEDASFLRDAFTTLSSVFSYLETYPYGKNRHLKKLCEPFVVDRAHSPTRLLKRVALIAGLAMISKNALLWILINVLFPMDVLCAYRLQQYRTRIASRLPAWLDSWFELEALSSLATFAYLNPQYILPAVLPDGQEMHFQAQGLGHPLIPDEQKVVNDFTIEEPGEVIIITGSNMSGKSTFLRTLGVNLCLAYAGGPVNATQFQTSLFRLFTCIKVSDSVTDGYSYFYAEVRRLKALLQELNSPGYPLFFLIDEIYRGTNNRERLLGSRAYVRALAGRNCVGAISTHDLELVRLADELPGVYNYHFREEVVEGHMVFDYLLRSGPSPTTNALKIMAMEGLPVED